MEWRKNKEDVQTRGWMVMNIVKAYLWFIKRRIFNNKKFTHCGECGKKLPRPVNTILSIKGIICDTCTIKQFSDMHFCDLPDCVVCMTLKQMKSRLEIEEMKKP